MGVIKIIVKAGNHTRVNCPVWTEIGGGKVDFVSMIDKALGEAIPCQIYKRENGETSIHWILDYLESGKERMYELTTGKDSSTHGPKGKVEIKDLPGDSLEILVNENLLTRYHFGKEWVRPFWYPLVGPFGFSITRNYPIAKDVPGETNDHHHHKSLWVAWGDVNGADDWSEEPGHARIVHKSFKEITKGEIFGGFVSENEWVDKEGKKLLDEERSIKVYNIGSKSRLFDVGVTFKVTSGDVKFGDTKEGGIISVRVASSMDVQRGGKIENAFGGINEGETWGKRSPWVDYSGEVNGRKVGIAIFDNPENFRYPTYWHVRDYGLFTANPFGISYFTNDNTRDGSYILKSGQSLKFSYRLYLHGGDAKEGNVGNKFHDYASPPAVSVSY